METHISQHTYPIYPGFLKSLQGNGSYKRMLKIDGFRVFQKEKGNPKSQAPHQNQTCESSMILCDSTLNTPTGSSTAQENRLPLKDSGPDGIFLSQERKG